MLCLPDEIGCQIFTTDSSYLKDVPAPPLKPNELAEVTVAVDILSILEIKEVDNFISLQLQVKDFFSGKLIVQYFKSVL